MRRTKLLLIGLLVAIPLLSWGAVAQAHSFHSGTNAIVPAGQTVDSTLFAAGQTVDVAGTVNGDVFCTGNSVVITGTVTGDVICAGQTVQVTGRVEGDVRVAAQNATLGGNIMHNLSVAGQTITTEDKSQVLGDVSIAGQTIALHGIVGRDLAVTAQSVVIDSIIARNVQANVQDITLGGSAKINGELAYVSPRDLTKSQGAVVVGTIKHTTPEHKQHHNFGAVVGVAKGLAVYMSLAFLVMALVLVLLFPRLFHSATTRALLKPGQTLLIGFAASIVAPVVIFGLMFTFVGIPLAIFTLLIWLVVVLLSGPVAAYAIGRLVLLRNSTNAIPIMLLGSLILLLLYFVPFLGVVAFLLAYWFGLGTIFLNLRTLPKPHYTMTPTASFKEK